MLKNLKSKKNRDIAPDEIFLDSTNLPEFDMDRFEGRIEKPISKPTIIILGLIMLIIAGSYILRVWDLEVQDGEKYLYKSENNRLSHTLVFAERGNIYDRAGLPLAWNEKQTDQDFSLRKYIDESGFGNLLGYVKYPSKDKYGFYYSEVFQPHDGVEEYYNDKLSGVNGLKITETDALGKLESESVIQPPKDGEKLALSIDAGVQKYFYKFMAEVAKNQGFSGGAGVIMDINSGEILSAVTYPEYNSNILSSGKDNSVIDLYTKNKNNPFLNRVISGLYAPGSIVKPFIAIGALQENIISPNKEIVSTGQISLANPFDPSKPSIFKDWKAHGAVDMRKALAVSSDVYFYEVGGGYQDQKGLGIENIDKYLKLFGFGRDVSRSFFSDQEGTIPTPEWKLANFNGDVWRIGDTYHTTIGQYGFQATPIQAVRAVSAIANGGNLLTPTVLLGGEPDSPLPEKIQVDAKNLDIVKEGMRDAVLIGTAKNLNIPQVEIAAKTGTAELGVTKQLVNSWIVGFFPYEHPKYAFATIMEKGDVHNTVGALYVMRQLFEWMSYGAPEYLK
ncbi:hypothetical protein IT397_01970 [Candidatus Nomurabacteria bacterium]|nr:hypothetical protein [Candidatus Nomurabacteria bacterium]